MNNIDLSFGKKIKRLHIIKNLLLRPPKKYEIFIFFHDKKSMNFTNKYLKIILFEEEKLHMVLKFIRNYADFSHFSGLYPLRLYASTCQVKGAR